MDKPLALKLAPKSLKEVYGQKHLIGKGAVLKNLVEKKKLVAMILYGKPGIGKTSIPSFSSRGLWQRGHLLTLVLI